MAIIPATRGGKLTCEPSQLGSVVVQSNGTVEAKCENVPAHLKPFPSRSPRSSLATLKQEQKNWILSVVYGIPRGEFESISMKEEALIENLSGTLTHPQSGLILTISIKLPNESKRGNPTPLRRRAAM